MGVLPGAAVADLAVSASASAERSGPAAQATRSGRTITPSIRAAASAEQDIQAKLGRLYTATAGRGKPPLAAAPGAAPRKRGRPSKNAAPVATSSDAEPSGKPAGPPGTARDGSVGAAAAAALPHYRAADAAAQEFIAAHLKKDANTGQSSVLGDAVTVRSRAAVLFEEVKIARRGSGVPPTVYARLTKHLTQLRLIDNKLVSEKGRN